MRVAICWALPVLMIFGCAGAPKDAADANKGPDNRLVLTLKGPGGSVSISDDLDSAKRAFPPAKGAMTLDSPTSFRIFCEKGWAWSAKDDSQSFEAAVRNGKIIAMATMNQNTTIGDQQLKDAIADLGEPTRKAESKNAALYVWESGTNARFFLRIRAQWLLGAPGDGWMIGPVEDLKMLNFRADDPAIFVRQLDAGIEQIKSGEISEAFRRAKEKALSKMKAEKSKSAR
ncbi:MAG: hypothetical protein U0R49_02770 [Fimbriimonadales bacterium]